MSRIFGYARVSTTEQTTENQKLEIKNSGFVIEDFRFIEESISGSVEAEKRPMFSKLMDKLEPGDVIVVTKLCRLGRSALDVRKTIEKLETLKVKVHCLALGGVDLTSAAGKMTMQIISAVAEFERDLLIERTKSGVARAKAEGKHCGRPPALNEKQKEEVLGLLALGKSVNSLSKKFNVTRQTIMRIREKHKAKA